MTFNGFNWPKQLAIALRERWLQVTVNVCVVTLNVEVKVRRSDRNEIKREAVSEAVGLETRGDARRPEDRLAPRSAGLVTRFQTKRH